MRLRIFLLAALLGLPSVGAGSAEQQHPSVAGAARTVSAQSSGARAAGTTGRYRPPIDGPLRVLRGFSPPATPYGPGHLGVDLSVNAGGVLAAAAGIVRFAGQVAGRGVLVIQHPDGISTEYEPVSALVQSGARVVEGQPIGRPAGMHRGCPEPACLHWGARRGLRYLDPMSLLRPLGVVRLLPWDGVPDG
jgi:murein DD-endopeptidase MepM/ murein hydrolase activator NlpD